MFEIIERINANYDRNQREWPEKAKGDPTNYKGSGRDIARTAKGKCKEPTSGQE